MPTTSPTPWPGSLWGTERPWCRSRRSGCWWENDCVQGGGDPPGQYRAQAVILACGGASYPGTGSNGDGYRLAAQAGHTIVEPGPSWCLWWPGGRTARGSWPVPAQLWGKGHPGGKKKPVYQDFGELLFTHFGLSGPTILSASAHMHPMEPGKYTVHLDLKPALDEGKLDARLLRELEAHKNKIFANSLDELLPQKLIPVVIARSGIPGETRCHSVTAAQRRGLLSVLKDFYTYIYWLPAHQRGHRHPGRGQPEGDRPPDHGVQAGERVVLCRGDDGRRRLHRRL